MRKVWAVHDNGHDLSATSKFGDLHQLYAPSEKINVFATDALARDIRDKLAGASEDDYLVLTGNALACCIAYAHLMRTHGRVNILIYSFRSSEYELRTIRDA